MRLFIILILLFPAFSYALDFGRAGKTYPIAEEDMLTEIERRVKATDWEGIFNREKERLSKGIGEVSLPLPPARFNSTRRLDLTATLDHDIQYRDQKTWQLKTLYPKGFKYNVLAHIESSDVFIVLNGKRPAEIAWYEKEWLGKPNVHPMVTEGNVIEITKRLKYPFTKASQRLIDKFQIRSTPTLFYQEGKLLRVDEIRVTDNESK